MTKNLWQKERKQIFKELTLQYQNEGYDSKTSRRLAKEELQDMLNQKEVEEHEAQQLAYESSSLYLFGTFKMILMSIINTVNAPFSCGGAARE